MKRAGFAFLFITAAGWISAQEVLFEDHFQSKLGQGWAWVREHREAWRVTNHGLEVLIEPGNMWGPQNNARNLLFRQAPDAMDAEIEVCVRIENQPTNQYEQADLVWYYNDSNMVKLGQELVDGSLSVVMGREEHDQTRTIAIIPLGSTAHLRQAESNPGPISHARRQAMARRRSVHHGCAAGREAKDQSSVLPGVRQNRALGESDRIPHFAALLTELLSRLGTG